MALVSPSLAGRVALVTGGGTGLGRAISLGLAAAGAAVAVNYSRSQAEAESAAAEIQAAGGQAAAVPADVSDERAVAAMLGQVERELGPVELLVNNAGFTRYVPWEQVDAIPVDLWRRILDVNLVGAFLCARAAAPGMRERGFGRIVNVSSNSALTAEGSSIPYVVSKGALITLTQCLARALAPAVQVNAVAPGWMATRWMERHFPPEFVEGLATDGVPTVPVEDVAASVVHLLANGSVTGQTLVVDCGEMWL